jgi:hypothetical protein
VFHVPASGFRSIDPTLLAYRVGHVLATGTVTYRSSVPGSVGRGLLLVIWLFGGLKSECQGSDSFINEREGLAK